MQIIFFNNQKGSSLIVITVLIFSIMTVVSLSVSEVVRNGLLMGRDQADATKAFFAAEAGAEQIIWNVWDGYDFSACATDDNICYDDTSWDVNSCGNCSGANETEAFSDLSAGFYQIIVNKDNAPTTTMISIGTYKDISRVIEVSY